MPSPLANEDTRAALIPSPQLCKKKKKYFSDQLPVLFDVERPLEFQVGVVVIVDKLGDGTVMGASHHSAGRFFRFNCRVLASQINSTSCECLTSLLIKWFFTRVGTVRPDHLLGFRANTHSLHDLEVLHTRQNLMLDLEPDFHAELRTLLDGKGLGFERIQLARLAQVDDDIRAAFDL